MVGRMKQAFQLTCCGSSEWSGCSAQRKTLSCVSQHIKPDAPGALRSTARGWAPVAESTLRSAHTASAPPLPAPDPHPRPCPPPSQAPESDSRPLPASSALPFFTEIRLSNDFPCTANVSHHFAKSASYGLS